MRSISGCILRSTHQRSLSSTWEFIPTKRTLSHKQLFFKTNLIFPWLLYLIFLFQRYFQLLSALWLNDPQQLLTEIRKSLVGFTSERKNFFCRHVFWILPKSCSGYIQGSVVSEGKCVLKSSLRWYYSIKLSPHYIFLEQTKVVRVNLIDHLRIFSQEMLVNLEQYSRKDKITHISSLWNPFQSSHLLRDGIVIVHINELLMYLNIQEIKLHYLQLRQLHRILILLLLEHLHKLIEFLLRILCVRVIPQINLELLKFQFRSDFIIFPWELAESIFNSSEFRSLLHFPISCSIYPFLQHSLDILHIPTWSYFINSFPLQAVLAKQREGIDFPAIE